METIALQRSVHQLDTAAKLLNSSDPVSPRLAHILTDNQVELLLHDYGQRAISTRYNLFGPKLKISDKKLAALSGRYLDAKISFGEERGILSADEAQFVRVAHHLRNTVYHLGAVHEDIMRSLTWHYHKIACRLLIRCRPGYDWSTPNRLPLVIKKHTKSVSFPGMFNKAFFNAIATSLHKMKKPLALGLQQALSQNLLKRLDKIDEDLTFLIEGDPNKRTAESLLAEVIADSNLKSSQVRPNKWRTRANGLVRETLDGKALQKYHQLANQLEELEVPLSQWVNSLWEHIDQQMDAMREQEWEREH